MTTPSPHLAAAGATWDDGPGAGTWIAPRLGEFGPTVGHAVPYGYERYAVVGIPHADDTPGSLDWLDALLDVLRPVTGDQRVHVGLWEGWGWLYGPGGDPRTAPGMGASVLAESRPRWWRRRRARSSAAYDAALAEAQEAMARERVERPDVEPLDLPERRYYLWTGPLRSALALHHQPGEPPSLIWPQDRSWFVGIPIYTREVAVAGPPAVIEAVLADPRLDARSASPDDILDIDD